MGVLATQESRRCSKRVGVELAASRSSRRRWAVADLAAEAGGPRGTRALMPAASAQGGLEVPLPLVCQDKGPCYVKEPGLGAPRHGSRQGGKVGVCRSRSAD